MVSLFFQKFEQLPMQMLIMLALFEEMVVIGIN